MQVDFEIVLLLKEDLREYVSSPAHRVALIKFCEDSRKTHEDATVTVTKQPGTSKSMLIDKLRSNFQNLESHKRPNLMTSKRESSKKFKVAQEKTRKVEFAWYVYDPETEDYRWVPTKQGGGARQKTGLAATSSLEMMLQVALELYFPVGNSSRHGNIKDFEHELRDYQFQKIESKKTLGDWYEQTGFNFLRFNLYSTSKMENLPHVDHSASNDSVIQPTDVESLISDSSVEPIRLNLLEDETKEVDIQQEMYPYPLERGKTDKVGQVEMLTVVHFQDMDDAVPMDITYMKFKESSYSEVIMRCLYYSKKMCYETTLIDDPEIQPDTFNPLEHGYEIHSIEKNGKVFMKFNQSSPKNLEGIIRPMYTFPRARNRQDVILHHPDEIWGITDSGIELGIITQQNPRDINFIWTKGNEIIKSGMGVSVITVEEAGEYQCIIEFAEVTIVSRSVTVCALTAAPYMVNMDGVHPTCF